MAVVVDGYTDCCTGGLEYLVDSVYIGYGDLVFEDDFEAADTCRWSAVSPPSVRPFLRSTILDLTLLQ